MRANTLDTGYRIYSEIISVETDVLIDYDMMKCIIRVDDGIFLGLTWKQIEDIRKKFRLGESDG